ncbi:MAG: BON domain-containing protein [Myxococcales bacterium]|nr:BON domain-containing protein [Myxococcales bacterium]
MARRLLFVSLMIDKPNARSSSSAPAAPARSYDALVRAVVPLPDSSHRPSADEAAAAEEPRAPVTEGPADVRAAVRAALDALPHADLADVQVAVHQGTATIAGSVARADDRDRIVAALSAIPGLVIVDELRVRL